MDALLVDSSDEARIGERITPQPNGCWLFNGKPEQYGMAWSRQGRPVSVHRFVYETLVGPIPDGWDLHHQCHTPGCCNPAHLTPLDKAEHRAGHNAERGS
jgi:hypothetical protein